MATSNNYTADGTRPLSEILKGARIWLNDSGDAYGTFPPGATLVFGYCMAVRDATGAEWAASPGDQCAFLPPPPDGRLTCKATAPTTIDLGTIAAGDGTKGEENVQIACQGGSDGVGSAIVTFRGAAGDSNITMSPGGAVTGTLYVVDAAHPGATGANVVLGVGENTVPIGAEVHASDQAVGLYTASGVVSVDYQ